CSRDHRQSADRTSGRPVGSAARPRAAVGATASLGELPRALLEHTQQLFAAVPTDLLTEPRPCGRVLVFGAGDSGALVALAEQVPMHEVPRRDPAGDARRVDAGTCTTG